MIEQNKCPKCGNSLDYGDSEIVDEQTSYDCECPKCGFAGIEWHGSDGFICFTDTDHNEVEDNTEDTNKVCACQYHNGIKVNANCVCEKEDKKKCKYRGGMILHGVVEIDAKKGCTVEKDGFLVHTITIRTADNTVFEIDCYADNGKIEWGDTINQ